MQQITSKALLGICAASILIITLIASSNVAPLKSEQAKKAKQTGVTETAIFAGGCFWCSESDFEKVKGVLEAVSGYTGGHTTNPTYKQVGSNRTGLYEAVKVTFDPKQVSYNDLLEVFWYSIDPTDKYGQFCDKGASYRTAIFTNSEAQAKSAASSKEWQQSKGKLKGQIVTPIIVATEFYDAEKYHQDYYKKNPLRYAYYRKGCGRDKRLRSIWGDKALSGVGKQKNS